MEVAAIYALEALLTATTVWLIRMHLTESTVHGPYPGEENII
jgi:hypothetical protein